ncbi:TPA: Eukaryotic translation initiation factor 4 gamma 1 [Trebouxia sp. C0005]
MDADEVSLRPLSLRPGGKSAKSIRWFWQRSWFCSQETGAAKVAEYEDEPKKPASEIVRYDRKFLLTFAERSYPPPEEIATAANAELLIDDIMNPQQAYVQRQVEPEQPDTRDWRSRTQLPAQPKDQQVRLPKQMPRLKHSNNQKCLKLLLKHKHHSVQKPTAQQQLSGASPKETDGPAPQIQRAADVGRQAWAPNTAALSLAWKSNYPSFLRLRVRGGNVLPPVLLNTCQEEFEGAAAAREVGTKHEQLPVVCWCWLVNVSVTAPGNEQVPQEQKESVTRTAKMRTLGNIRLIAELFKKSVVPEKIVHMCIQDLTVMPSMNPLKTMWSVCTEQAEDGVLFQCNGEVDGEQDTAQQDTLHGQDEEEIHAEAHAELGMMPATLIPALESLSALPRQPLTKLSSSPPSKETMIRKGSNQAGESALTGDWKPMDAAPQPEPAPPAPTPAAQPQPAVSSLPPFGLIQLRGYCFIQTCMMPFCLQFLLWSPFRQY